MLHYAHRVHFQKFRHDPLQDKHCAMASAVKDGTREPGAKTYKQNG